MPHASGPIPRDARPTLRRYWLITGGLLLFFLALFGVVEALGVPILTDPSALLGRGGVLAGAAGVGLLVADVVLPVPSSVVMVAHGALFGVAVGTALSLAGSLGAAALGFFLGRRSARLVERIASPREKAYADQLLARWGTLAVIVTRPIPLLAETVIVLAGASRLGWGRALGASLAGSLPPALLYSFTGATSRDFASGAVMFGLVLLIAGLLWLVGKRAA